MISEGKLEKLVEDIRMKKVKVLNPYGEFIKPEENIELCDISSLLDQLQTQYDLNPSKIHPKLIKNITK